MGETTERPLCCYFSNPTVKKGPMCKLWAIHSSKWCRKKQKNLDKNDQFIFTYEEDSDDALNNSVINKSVIFENRVLKDLNRDLHNQVTVLCRHPR